MYIYIYMYMYIGYKTSFYVVRHLDSIASYLANSLHLGFFRSWPSLYLPSSFSSVFFVLFCFGIHFNAILGNLPSAILRTWPYHASWFCSISFIKHTCLFSWSDLFYVFILNCRGSLLRLMTHTQ